MADHFIQRPPSRGDRLDLGTHLQVRKGDYVWLSGYALRTAQVYELDRDEFAWFIEFTDTLDGKGYHYWKQIPDGGQLWVEPQEVKIPGWDTVDTEPESRCPGCNEALGFCKSLPACYEAAYGSPESKR